MKSRPPRAASKSLSAARRRFERWRRTRKAGARIPEALWSLAVDLARGQGVSKIALGLGLDYYSLKSRLEASPEASAASASGGPAFIEMPLPALACGPGCVLELQDDRGLRLRVELEGAALSDVHSVARALWEATR
jgi:hypothetical protein